VSVHFDAIVAGAGMWGCTVARCLAESGKKVLVLEKRRAVGGNCRCKTIDGIEVHLYGSHIFHTSNEEVWKFVTRFATFNDYRHSVLARTRALPPGADARRRREVEAEAEGGGLYHLPIGKTLLEEFFGIDMKNRNLNDFLKETIDVRSPTPTSNSNSSVTHGDALFDAFIRGYTSKQWGVPPEKVDPSIIARLKVRDNYSTDYFDDPHQGIPVEGYNELFRKMLDHPNIVLRTSSSLKLKSKNGGVEPVLYDEIKKTSAPFSNSNSSLQLYYSGPLDALFNYKYGALPWRSLRFETEKLARRDYQGATVVNYTDAAVPYTRIHEFKHYHPEVAGRRPTKDVNIHSPTPTSNSNSSQFYNSSHTIITHEYPANWQKGDEPYYPINTPESAALLAKYQAEVEKYNQAIKQSNNPNNQTILVIGGRLGGYKYYDMDKSIEAALNAVNERT